jgi:hypothetical protein
MKSQFRATTPQDALAVTAFLHRIFDIPPGLPVTSPAHLHWKNWANCPGWPESRGYVMTAGNEIVAHATVVPLILAPLVLRSGQQRLTVAHLIDWAADPKSVGSGVILLKRIAHMVDAILAVGGGDMTERVMPALGFKTYGEATKFVLPLRPLRRLIAEKPSLLHGAKFARSILWAMQAPTVQTDGWTAIRIAPEDVTSAGILWPSPSQSAAVFERTAESMAYFLRCPASPMELYAVAKNGDRRGYFLLAYAPGQARIADFYLDSDDPADWRILVQLAVSQAKRNPAAAEIVSMSSDPVTSRALADCGFQARRSAAVRLLPAAGVELPSAAIRFQMIDNDFAYLHQNKTDFWG